MHAGAGPGLTRRSLGEKGGVENVTLTVQQVPAHSHTATATRTRADTKDPTGTSWAGPKGEIYAAPDNPVAMADSSIAPTGGGQAHTNMPPFLAMNYIIALQGTFPSRS